MSKFKVGDEVRLIAPPIFDGKPGGITMEQDLIVGEVYTVEELGDDAGAKVYTGHIDTGTWWCAEECFELVQSEPTEEEIAALFGLAPPEPSDLEQAQAEIARLKSILDREGISYE